MEMYNIASDEKRYTARVANDMLKSNSAGILLRSGRNVSKVDPEFKVQDSDSNVSEVHPELGVVPSEAAKNTSALQSNDSLQDDSDSDVFEVHPSVAGKKTGIYE